ncbi:MAG TPA: isocitrate lyase/phosphoenolpyruvate mutase family protein [Candidatus Rubrimentiphilum sp.]|nr:isocitrate lyase/phosphoenolpyruvate mutase family protein [Candidatus Rubrimentiphilum sp.]
MSSQAEKAEQLRALHHAEQPLVLVNVWDVAGAKILEELGFPAVATASAAIAASLGYDDNEEIGRGLMLETVARIAEAVDVPVTADLEAGYGPTVEDAVATARGAIEAGAVGLNFEDSAHKDTANLYDADLQAERIRAIRDAGKQAGVPLVINARTDVYFRTELPDEEKYRESLRRAKIYAKAGADCIYILGVTDEEAIANLVRNIPAPLNILALPDAPPIARLAELGVKRISYGPRPMRHAMTAFREAAQNVRDQGTFP